MSADCFPPWLQRKTSQQIGPNFPDTISYPVYQDQPSVISADNPNSRSAHVTESFYQSAASQISMDVIDLRLVHVMPNNVYDTINITCFTSPGPAAGGSGRIMLPALPIFFSMDRPHGRIVSETMIGSSQEAFLAVATAFDPVDPSALPTCIQMPNNLLGYTNGGVILNTLGYSYTNLVIQTVKTNRPFYFWFSDSILQLPPTLAGPIIPKENFKVSWYVQGR